MTNPWSLMRQINMKKQKHIHCHMSGLFRRQLKSHQTKTVASEKMEAYL